MPSVLTTLRCGLPSSGFTSAAIPVKKIQYPTTFDFNNLPLGNRSVSEIREGLLPLARGRQSVSMEITTPEDSVTFFAGPIFSWGSGMDDYLGRKFPHMTPFNGVGYGYEETLVRDFVLDDPDPSLVKAGAYFEAIVETEGAPTHAMDLRLSPNGSSRLGLYEVKNSDCRLYDAKIKYRYGGLPDPDSLTIDGFVWEEVSTHGWGELGKPSDERIQHCYRTLLAGMTGLQNVLSGYPTGKSLVVRSAEALNEMRDLSDRESVAQLINA